MLCTKNISEYFQYSNIRFFRNRSLIENEKKDAHKHRINKTNIALTKMQIV